VVRLQLDKICRSHRQVFESLREQGIGVNLHYIPVHTQPYYQKMGFSAKDFPEAMGYYREAISLPMFQGLTDELQDEVVKALKYALTRSEE
jgi:dTDP-4-amino-4,6-dideoxygalactose transaminase